MRNLYVSSLPSTYSTEQLVALFAQWQVESARFMEPRSPSGARDSEQQQQHPATTAAPGGGTDVGRPDHRGYGFVSFRDEATALQAMHAMIGVLIDGVKIQVRPAKSRAPSGGGGGGAIVHDEISSPPITPPEMNLALPTVFNGGGIGLDSKSAAGAQAAPAPTSSDISTTMQFIPIDAAYSGDHSSLANRSTYFASPSASTSSFSAELFPRSVAMAQQQPTAMPLPSSQHQYFSAPCFFPPAMQAQLTQPAMSPQHHSQQLLQQQQHQQQQQQQQQISWPTLYSTDGGATMLPFVALSSQQQQQHQPQQTPQAVVVPQGLHDPSQFLASVPLSALVHHHHHHHHHTVPPSNVGTSAPVTMASYAFPARPNEYLFHPSIPAGAAAPPFPVGPAVTYQDMSHTAVQPQIFYTGAPVGQPQQFGGGMTTMQPLVFSAGSQGAAF